MSICGASLRASIADLIGPRIDLRNSAMSTFCRLPCQSRKRTLIGGTPRTAA